MSGHHYVPTTTKSRDSEQTSFCENEVKYMDLRRNIMFRICSEFLVIYRIFRLFSEYLAQKLVCSESLDFVVVGT
jgi:hypothetical protein